MLLPTSCAIFATNSKQHFEESKQNLKKLAEDFKKQSVAYQKIVARNFEENRKRVLKEIQAYKQRCCDFIKLTEQNVLPENSAFHKRTCDQAIKAGVQQQKILDESIKEFYNSCGLTNQKSVSKLTSNLQLLLNPSEYSSVLATEMSKLVNGINMSDQENYLEKSHVPDQENVVEKAQIIELPAETQNETQLVESKDKEITIKPHLQHLQYLQHLKQVNDLQQKLQEKETQEQELINKQSEAEKQLFESLQNTLSTLDFFKAPENCCKQTEQRVND